MKGVPVWFAVALSMYDRIAIVGGPGTGKTTLSKWAGSHRPVLGTDEYQTMPWEDVPRHVINKTRTLGRKFVVEGVHVARALRKGLEVDAVIHLETLHRPDPLPGQLAMGKGVETVFAEWRESPTGSRIPVFGEEGNRK